MVIDCIVIGFNDESMNKTIKRVEPYKDKGAAYSHMISRSVLIGERRLKYSEIVQKSISYSTKMESDLSIYRMPNMATHYLAQYLKKRGMTVEIINNYNFDKEKIKELLQAHEIRCVAISSTCHVEAAPIREVVDYVRSFKMDAQIAVGGPFINSINFEYEKMQQEYILHRIGADIYVHERQGEETLYKICLELQKNKPDLSSVPNILYKENNEIIRTSKLPENICLDMDPVKELTFYENHVKPPVYVQTGLSCSMRCAFCRYPVLGGELVQMTVESIEKNMNYLHSIGVKYLVFIDDSLNIPLDRFKNMLKMMIKNKYNFKWFSFFRISHSDEETYELMSESGCTGVILGVESGNNTILKNMDKQVTVEKLKWGIEELTKHNIISYASCMVGFPGETEKTAADTIRFIEESKPTFFDLQVWFYEKAVPIAKESDYYKLEGYGYSWSHKDMNSTTASKIVMNSIHSINSYFMPALSFNLWSLAYYMSQGIKLEEFKTFSERFMKVAGYEMNNIDKTYDYNLNELLNTFINNKDLHSNLKIRQ